MSDGVRGRRQRAHGLNFNQTSPCGHELSIRILLPQPRHRFPPSQRRASRLAPASQPAASVWQCSGAPEQITCQEARLHTHQKSRGDTEQRRRGRAEANLRKVDLPSLAVSFASQSLRPWAICQTTASCPIPINKNQQKRAKATTTTAGHPPPKVSKPALCAFQISCVKL